MVIVRNNKMVYYKQNSIYSLLSGQSCPGKYYVGDFDWHSNISKAF